jgi:alpha-L-rhamnosidase
MQIQTLLCETLENPVGIDTKHPRLGWICEVIDTEFNKVQTAYQIIVASTSQKLEKNEGDMWDSGKVQSDESVYVEYAGKDLSSRLHCYWKVQIWDEQDQCSGWSKPASWIMGIFPEDWKGDWIGNLDNVSYEERFPISTELADCPEWLKPVARREHPDGDHPENKFAMALYLRKTFTIKKPIQQAVIRIAGIGYHELELNGQKIGDHVLDPGATDYTKSVLYTSYDITTALTPSENCVGVILGNGWYWVGTPDLFGFENALWAAPPRLKAEIQLRFEDGSEEFVVSDDSWDLSDQGPIRFNCIRSGEVYDAQMELGPWSTATYQFSNDSRWKKAQKVTPPKGILRSQLSPSIKIRDSFAPCNRNILENEKIVYWFPKNNAGWVEVKIKGQKGQRIKIELNEKLTPQGEVDMVVHSGHTYGRYQTCEYICKGNGIEIYHPRFCYAGFQYVQITGCSADQILEIYAQQVCTAFESAGKFLCSNHLINSINQAAKLTFLNGYHSYPEDCPQREKAGWTEDALISAHGSVYNYEAMLAYEKWIQDLMDAQHEPSGQVPDIVPTPFWGKPEKTSDEIGGTVYPNELCGRMADPWWGGTLVMLPWKIYEHYGDIRILERSYDNMKKYVEFLLKTTRISENDYTYLINWASMLGEWLEVGSHGSANRTPRILTCTQAFFKCVYNLAQTARILGKKDDAARYSVLATNIQGAFNEEFLNSQTGLYAPDSQSAQAMSLVLGLVPKEMERKAFEGLVDNVVNIRKGHLSTGIVGTYFLYKALSQFGRPDVAYSVITKSGFPGFEHNLTRVLPETPIPSTTLWEDWGGVSSLAHPVQGTVVSFFYEQLAGILPNIEHPGFKVFTITPQFLKDLFWVKSSLKTRYGLIECNWQQEEGKIQLQIQIPVNTHAKVILPAAVENQLSINKKSIVDSEWRERLEVVGGFNTLTLGSGRYMMQFSLKN